MLIQNALDYPIGFDEEMEQRRPDQALEGPGAAHISGSGTEREGFVSSSRDQQATWCCRKPVNPSEPGFPWRFVSTPRSGCRPLDHAEPRKGDVDAIRFIFPDADDLEGKGLFA
jgi:hypothetical protein